MDKPQGILVFGANGSGKTTLGRELAKRMGFKHMDHEAYAFKESAIPYTEERSREDCLALLLEDIRKHGAFVLSAVTGDFGEEITRHYRLAVQLSVPLALRLRRIEQREYARHGARVLEGGDMYASRRQFIDFVASRSLSNIDAWAQALPCPVLRLDGTDDLQGSAKKIAERYDALQG